MCHVDRVTLETASDAYTAQFGVDPSNQQDLVDANYKLEQAQKELTEARAMARLGQMTAGAAHEMNNPLAVMIFDRVGWK